MQKKGVSIAIEQVVIVIISVVILSLGVALAFKIYSTSERQLAPISGQLEKTIEQALSSGSVVEMPVSVKKISAKEMAEFWFGIKNDPAVTTSASSSNNEFTVTVSYGSALSPNGQEICQIPQCITGMKNAMVLPPEFSWIDPTSPQLIGAYSYSFQIPENKIRSFGLGILPKNNPSYGGRGQYYYNLCVCNSQTCANPCTAENFADANEVPKPYGFITFSVIVG